MMTLATFLDGAVEETRARANRRIEWRRARVQREQQATYDFCEYMRNKYGIDLGDEVTLNAEEHNDPEPDCENRTYWITMGIPSIDAWLETRLEVGLDGVKRTSQWNGIADNGHRYEHENLSRVLLWLTDHGAIKIAQPNRKVAVGNG